MIHRVELSLGVVSPRGASSRGGDGRRSVEVLDRGDEGEIDLDVGVLGDLRVRDESGSSQLDVATTPDLTKKRQVSVTSGVGTSFKSYAQCSLLRVVSRRPRG